MPNKKISEYDAITVLAGVDLFEVSQHVSGSTYTSKKITAANVVTAMLADHLAAADPHTQYVLSAGESGGQTIRGDTASGGNITITSTSHATKGRVNLNAAGTVYLQESTGVLNTLAIAAAGHLTFTDNTYDVGASGATRPRDLHLCRREYIGDYAASGIGVGTGAAISIGTGTGDGDRAGFYLSHETPAGTFGFFMFQDGNVYIDGGSASVAWRFGADVMVLTLAAGGLTLGTAANINTNTSTGTIIATTTAQKLGFWGATAIIQPASANQAILSLDVDVTGADTVDKAAINTNFTAIQTLVNQLRADLIAAGIIKGAA